MMEFGLAMIVANMAFAGDLLVPGPKSPGEETGEET